MCDREGDKQNNIYTIPVIFGNQNTWIFTAIILNGNILLNAFSLYYVFDYYKGLFLLFLCSPMIYDLCNIQASNYDKLVITKAVKKTSSIMFLILVYFAYLTVYK
jgi:1,4-dihydroxy-2-naphthoate octaprenyltransferase